VIARLIPVLFRSMSTLSASRIFLVGLARFLRYRIGPPARPGLTAQPGGLASRRFDPAGFLVLLPLVNGVIV
jgi:hypothetical protein